VVTFAEPAWLWLVVAAAAACVAAALRHRWRRAVQRHLASPAVWQRLMGGVPATGLFRLLTWSAALALVAVGLARPQWGEAPSEEMVVTRDLVVALDVSDSMRCPDLSPSRLRRSLDLVHRVLPSLEGNRVGVVVFAGEAYALVPLTSDLEAVSTFLSAVEPGMISLPGSNLEQAVGAALRLLPESGEGRLVTLITDGENLQGDVGAAVRALRARGVPLLAVMAGTQGGGPIPVSEKGRGVRYRRDQDGRPVVTRAHPEVLQQLAEVTDGAVVDLGSADAVALLLANVDALRTRQVAAHRRVRLIERFPLFLMAAAVLLAVGFAAPPWRRMAWLALMAAVLTLPAHAQTGLPQPGAPAGAPSSMPPPSPAAGADAEIASPPAVPWWQRWLPGGSRRMARSGAARWAEGDLPGAGRAFAGAAVLDPESPDRLYDLGTVVAAAGELEQAAPLLGQAHEGGAEHAAFNLGTAALASDEAELAVASLRQALLRRPGDPGVKRNYELALKLLEEQQEQEQQQDEEDQEEQEEQEEEQQDEPEPTPSPAPSPSPTPTEDQQEPLYAALERAEEEAREQMNKPTPQAGRVEKDW